MTVLPLYWRIWHDLPTSLPPPRHTNMSSSDGSTGSSTVGAIAEALRFDAMRTAESLGVQGNKVVAAQACLAPDQDEKINCKAASPNRSRVVKLLPRRSAVEKKLGMVLVMICLEWVALCRNSKVQRQPE